MRFGFCVPAEQAGIVAQAGYDYFEPAVVATVQPEVPERDVLPGLREKLGNLAIKPEAFNVFLPGDLRLTGPAPDADRQKRYVESALARVAAVGGEVVVFGSAGARRVPGSFPPNEAAVQIMDFLDICAPIAAAHGITIVIEPLNRGECNIILSVAEAMNYVRTVAHPSIQVLSDLYHVSVESQPYAQTAEAGAALRHVHVAGKGRRSPTLDDVEFLRGYFAVLKSMGYDGRISVEGKADDLERDAPIALKAMKKAWQMA